MNPIFYRKADLQNKKEIELIALEDIEIPALFDADFSTDEKALQEELKRLEKITDEDFFDVAVSESNEIIGFHIIKKNAYFDRFAGCIYTLWVSPSYRKMGIATELKKRGEAWARELKLDHIYTWVHVDNHKMLSLNEERGYNITHHKMIKKFHY